MKLAIIGSRNLKCNGLSQIVPPETTEIISGGARGIDTCAKEEINGLLFWFIKINT